MERMIEERQLLSQKVASDSVQAEEKEEEIAELNEAIESLEMQVGESVAQWIMTD